MSDWRLAGSLIELRTEVDAHFPGRSKASDGTIGDTAHQNEGSSSDHNPWVHDSNGVPVVRAFDITHDPAHGVDTYAMADRFRVARDLRVSYIISNRRICYGPGNPNQHTHWVWQTYTGTSDPHTNHMHVSVSTIQSAYDNPAPWTGVAAPTPPPPEDDMLDLTQKIPSAATPDVPGRTLGQVLGDLWHQAQQNNPKALADLSAKVDAIGTSVGPTDEQVNAAVLAALQRPEVAAAIGAAVAGHLHVD